VSAMREVVVVDAVRSPMGRSKGGMFRNVRSENLSAAVINALLRRRPEVTEPVLVVGDLRIDAARHRCRRGEREVELSRREFDLLETLARNAGIVLSRSRLLDLVWGYDFEVNTNVVDVFVGYLREKLEAGGEPRMIHTVRGVGFVLRP